MIESKWCRRAAAVSWISRATSGEACSIDSYWLERRWNAVKYRFDDPRFREERYPLHFQVMEEQAAFVAARFPDLTGTDIGQAYLLAGLQIDMAVDRDLTCRFEGFAEGVWELAQRCLATCHPDHNPKVAGAGYEVEFATLGGRTLTVLTVREGDVRPVGDYEIAHARQFAYRPRRT